MLFKTSSSSITGTAIKLYFATIMNSNFEGWFLQNPDKSFREFEFSFSKMSKSGPIFDLEKLINLSKNYLSKLKASEVYDNLVNWAKEYDVDFYNLINNYKDYTTNILNIEREQKKPRKDYSCYSEIKSLIWYMYDELYTDLNYEWQSITDKDEIKLILNTYIEKYYNVNDKESWFNNIKELSEELGYASNMKDYKENPDNYKGNVADVSTVLRVALTTKSMTPDLYEIMRLLGKERIEKRINNI